MSDGFRFTWLLSVDNERKVILELSLRDQIDTVKHDDYRKRSNTQRIVRKREFIDKDSTHDHVALKWFSNTIFFYCLVYTGLICCNDFFFSMIDIPFHVLSVNHFYFIYSLLISVGKISSSRIVDH